MNTVAPEKVGMSSARLARIRPVVEKYVNEGKFAGVLTLAARRGEVAHFECVGMMDKEASKPMQENTLFRIYSMTKPITSLALLMLYEEGHVRLNDPISRFIPAFKDLKIYVRPLSIGMELAGLQREITVRDLLTHTSGLTYSFFEDTPVDALYRKVEILRSNRSLKEFVEELVKLPLVHQPGTVWRYSVATDVVGYLVELISGMPLDKFFEERIFQPLGMIDTGFMVPSEKVSRLSTVYEFRPEGRLEPIDTPANSEFTMPRRFLGGGGGLVSTIADYLRFAQMMLNGGELNGARLVSRMTIELMTINHLPAHLLPFGVTAPNNGAGFGLGVSVLMDLGQYGGLGSVGAYSWGGAATTTFWVDPKENLIGILMTQCMPSFHFPITDDFRVLAYQAIAD
jgi:CubicO group peptidase (beta-lactamase class C family)